MSDGVTLFLDNAQQGHAQLQQAWMQHLKPHLMAGRRKVLRIEDYEDALTEAQRSYYHGVVLQFIADYGLANGQKFPMAVWKEWARDRFLGFKVKTFTNPMTGRKSRRRVRVSTEDLGVRGYANLIDKVIAFASTELGLTIPEPRQPLPKPTRRRETVDQTTGEILEVAA